MNIATIALFAAQMLFPAAETKPEGYDGAQVRVEDGAAVVDVAASHKYSGVNFVFTEPFALNHSDFWCAEVSNRTDRALDFISHGIAKGTPKRFANRNFRLGPGESKVIKAPCNRKCYTIAPGSQGLPGMTGYDIEFKPDHLDKSSTIASIIIFSTLQESPAQFDVKRLWVEGEQADRTIKIDDAFFPFVDEFGQYVHAEWPGKIHSLDELKASAKAEDAELAAHPDSPIPGADRFGGWGAGPQLKATGLFRTEKWNGRWWLVDPDGHIFFSLGCNYVRLQSRTPVTAREKFFAWLPEKNDPLFGDCWYEGRHEWLQKCFYQGKGMVAQFDFAQANQ